MSFVESCGHLATQDPLHAYLSQSILPQLGAPKGRKDFRVFSLKHSKVYLYEEKNTRLKLVGKFFADQGHAGEEASQRMSQEFENLQVLRGYGLAGYPHHVVRPLGTNDGLN